MALKGRNEEGLDTEIAHALGNAYTVLVDITTHEGGIGHLGGIGDEGDETVLFVLDGADAIGEADSTGLGAVDGDGDGEVDTEIVEQELDEDAHHPHEQGADEEEYTETPIT